MRNDEQKQILRIRALELRIAGKSWRAIAADIGVGHETARRWVKEQLDADELPLVEETRRLEMERMLRYLDKLDEQIEDGNIQSISLALKVSAEMRKMLGADAPQRVEVEKKEISQVDLAIQDLLNRQKAQNALRLTEAASLRTVADSADGSLDSGSGSDIMSDDRLSEAIENIIAEN